MMQQRYTCPLCGVAAVATSEDACDDCAREEYLFLLLVLVRAGDLSDWSPQSWNHARHMTDEKEGSGGNWEKQLDTMLEVLLPLLDDGAGYGE